MLRRQLPVKIVNLIILNVVDFFRDHDIRVPHVMQLGNLRSTLLQRTGTCEVGVDSANPHGIFYMRLVTHPDDGWAIVLTDSNGHILSEITARLREYVRAALKGDRFVLTGQYVVGIDETNRGVFAKITRDNGMQQVGPIMRHEIVVLRENGNAERSVREFWGDFEVSDKARFALACKYTHAVVHFPKELDWNEEKLREQPWTPDLTGE